MEVCEATAEKIGQATAIRMECVRPRARTLEECQQRSRSDVQEQSCKAVMPRRFVLSNRRGEPKDKKSPQRFSAPMRDFIVWGQRPARQSCKRDHPIFRNGVQKWGGQACLTCAGELNRGLRVQRKRSVQEGLPSVTWSVQRKGSGESICNHRGNQI